MRRNERQVTDSKRIREIVEDCRIIRVGLADGKSVYVVPVNFGYREDEKGYTFYFHGARAGRKFELITRNGYAGFEMDCGNSIKEADQACGHSEFYRSGIGEGAVTEVTEPEEKKEALSLIMKHARGDDREWDFPEKMLAATGVFRIDPMMLTFKENL